MRDEIEGMRRYLDEYRAKEPSEDASLRAHHDFYRDASELSASLRKRVNDLERAENDGAAALLAASTAMLAAKAVVE